MRSRAPRDRARRRDPEPGRLELSFLLLDVNGTLTDRGELLDGVAERLAGLRATLEPQLLSADTFGTLDAVAARPSAPAQVAASAEAKLAALRR